MKNQIRILAVDDEKFNLLLLQACLKDDRFYLKTCSNAIETLNEFKKQDFDVVLSDILMDGIDGFEVRNLIREINRTVPIIFLTSMVDDLNSTLLNRIADDQYSYYMNKAFNQEHLIRKIEQAVASYREQQSSHVYYRKLEDDLSLAGNVQRIMLPNWCCLSDRMLMSYLYIPSMKVSGDMIELMKIDEDRSFFFIGDIAGHGIQAALYMSAVQSYLKVLLANPESRPVQPHEVLNKIEKFFRSDLGSKTYMTCVAAVFNFKDKHLSFQSAGHPGLICCSPSEGIARQINTGDHGGLPVGLSRKNVYVPEDTVEFDFQDDSIFVAYTDGLLDLANSAGENIEMDFFLSMLGQLSKDSYPAAIPFRMRSVINQIGFNNVPDDISMAIIQKRRTTANNFQLVIPADMGEVSRGVAVFADFIKAGTGCEKLSTKVELLLSEFLNNVIVHGLEASKHTQTDIYIRVQIFEKTICVRVMDRGKEWNYSPSSSISCDDVLESKNKALATSGRGMAIIHSITSSIARNHYCGLNETVFSIIREENK